MPNTRDAAATFEFDPNRLTIGNDDLRDGLSGVVFDGQSLWLACDEGCRLERLSQSGSSGLQFASHVPFELKDLIQLPADPAEDEADVEGLDTDDGYLWFVGSHSMKRKNVDGGKPSEVSKKLEKPKRDGNRHLLGRIPLAGRELVRSADSRKSGTIGTSVTSSALLDAIVQQKDPHLAPFVSIPGKDNGLDIEGLAVRGMRAFVGLRGPVLREWCCVLELRLDADPSGALALLPMDGTSLYRKHFLKLNGLGVRDLVLLEDDLLVLVGPPLGHDGPTEVWRWKDAANAAAGATPVQAARVLSIPHGEKMDRAEGITLVDHAGSPALLVVFDSPSPNRKISPSSLQADVFKLP